MTVLALSNDVLLAVRASQLAAVFRAAIEELTGYNLQMNLPKCHDYCPRQGALQEAGLPEDLPIAYEGLLHLGVPLGTGTFVNRELDKIAQSCELLLNKLKELDDAKVALLILHMSAAPKLTHLTRFMSLYSPPLVGPTSFSMMRALRTRSHNCWT